MVTCILIKYSLLTLLTTGAGRGPARHPNKDTVSQGIEGFVYRASGNHMPSPGVRTGPPIGVRSTVYVFELTGGDQVTREGSSSYFSRIQTRLIKQAGTDSNG